MKCRPFISYAREDLPVAERIEADLRRMGADPWLDTRELRGGQEWKKAIREALNESTHVIVLLSVNSVTKAGYIQKEVRLALELLDNLPPDRVFLLPVRVDDTRPQHERLAELHWIDLFPNYSVGIQKVVASLNFPTVTGFDENTTSLLTGTMILASPRPDAGTSLLWRRNRAWRIVFTLIVGALVIALGLGLRALYRFNNSSDAIAFRQHETGVGPNSFVSVRCDWVQLRGHIHIDGAETLVWFEWGETPELGKVTPTQRFNVDTVFYHDLVDLKENTRYWYRARSSQSKTEGRVYSFRTNRCKDRSP